ncbi:hypothetical protein [Variovorax atrisoli]|uniref:hypothetical protein n=1 Tax=Variovorax atrisoli TaxID=3394203 RepID=UPI00404003FE
MSRKDQDPNVDPLKLMMENMLEGFQRTTDAINALREKQAKLESQQKQQARAAYQGMTGSGKSRYVNELVKIEAAIDARGAQARVAELLELSPPRISQLIRSDKNRANGK